MSRRRSEAGAPPPASGPTTPRGKTSSTHSTDSTAQPSLFDLGPPTSTHEPDEVDPVLASLSRPSRGISDPLDGFEPKGSTIVPELDRERLGRQLRAVLECLERGGEWTLAMFSEAGVPGILTSISARTRDLKRLGFVVETKRKGMGGVWTTRLVRGPA